VTFTCRFQEGRTCEATPSSACFDYQTSRHAGDTSRRSVAPRRAGIDGRLRDCVVPPFDYSAIGAGFGFSGASVSTSAMVPFVRLHVAPHPPYIILQLPMGGMERLPHRQVGVGMRRVLVLVTDNQLVAGNEQANVDGKEPLGGVTPTELTSMVPSASCWPATCIELIQLP
jgi:hypothetical protein